MDYCGYFIESNLITRQINKYNSFLFFNLIENGKNYITI